METLSCGAYYLFMRLTWDKWELFSLSASRIMHEAILEAFTHLYICPTKGQGYPIFLCPRDYRRQYYFQDVYSGRDSDSEISRVQE